MKKRPPGISGRAHCFAQAMRTATGTSLKNMSVFLKEKIIILDNYSKINMHLF
jgi:hypothetical protein